MLYPSYNSFAIDYSKPTMTKKDGSTFNAQRNNLSYIDIVAIYDIYVSPLEEEVLPSLPSNKHLSILTTIMKKITMYATKQISITSI